MKEDGTMLSDEHLTAFIDGVLSLEEAAAVERRIDTDPAVAERVEFLMRASLPFAEAYRPLIDEAPVARLEAMLDLVSAARPARSGLAISRRGLLAALAASVAFGMVFDRFALQPLRGIGAGDGEEQAEAGEWRGLVAQYMALYDADTLVGVAPPRERQEAELGTVNERLALTLTPQAVALDGADFKRAQVLSYDGRPLAQILYLDPKSGPLAFCIVRKAGPVIAPDTEQRLGMTVVHWSNGSHALMLIGHAPKARMQALARDLASRMSA
ncbi:MAG: anti-sigma factor [Rhizobium sp.]|nr:anti-sigma factor [Rhizobium sp.]